MKVLLEAPILTQSGYGEHSRLVFRALREYPDADIYVNPLSWGTTSWLSDSNKERLAIDECIRKNVVYFQQAQSAQQQPQYDMQVHVGIPNEFEKKASYSVCVTAGIETTKISPRWISSINNGIDKVIVPSQHAKLGFTDSEYNFQHEGREVTLECRRTPVDVVPYPVKDIESDLVDLDLEYDFNFLSIAMWGERKNIPNMLKWFVEEFRDDKVGLVLKTTFSRNSTPDLEFCKKVISNLLSEFGERTCKIYLLHGDLSEQQLHSLYENPKIKSYVSSTLFEAAYSGLPVVTTDWSGHLDFLYGETKDKKSGKKKRKALFAKVEYSLENVQPSAVWQDIIVPDSQWAYPTEKSFKSQIRKMYKQHGIYRGFAKTLKAQVRENFQYSKVLEQMKEALVPEHLRRDKEWDDTLSSIEIL